MSGLSQPAGQVTLVFTDVEGSTKLLDELGVERYREALGEHRRIVRESFAVHSGYEVDYEGDAFFYAFASPEQAIEAIRLAMDGLGSGPIRIRVGVHTGAPVPDPPKYVGMDVHLAARIMSSGHGGQVVVSGATVSRLDEGVFDLTDLGEHRLKDIGEPVALYQLGGDSFPPLRTISNTNLPRPASSFVGRESELQEVVSRLNAGTRLLTLTGPGGTGKTRLALEAASRVVASFKAGVFWVGLASVRDPALVTDTIAQVLGAKEGLVEHIATRELLLLLDNVEQVVESAPKLGELLSACPNLRFLVTSRELLRVSGEVECAVPPLARPEAVALFCERSRLEPGDDIAELCDRLDSLPLAVELAAARTTALTPAQILDRLSTRLDLLRGGRDADPRQWTLRAAIEWSYDLLSTDEQRLFAAISVFVGGCTFEAAEAVCGADLDTLQSLVEKSLLRFTNGRYWMLETIREYAEEQLLHSDRFADAKARHLDYVRDLVDRLEATFASDAERERFAAELDNYRAALAWAESANLDAQLDLIGRSWPFWWYRGRPSEGLRWVQSALSRTDGQISLQRAKVLTAGAMFAYRARDLDTSKAYAEESLAIAHELDEPAHTIWPHIFVGLSASERGDLPTATAHHERAIKAASETGARRLVGIATNNLGVMAEQAGDVPRAAKLYEESVDILRELGTPDDMPVALLNLARCLRSLSRPDEAVTAAKKGLALAHESGNRPSLIDGCYLLGALAQGQDDGRAAKLVGIAEILRDRFGDIPERHDAEFRAAVTRDVIDAIGEDRYKQALAEAGSIPLDDAVDYALAES